jgi:hypothetical protein
MFTKWLLCAIVLLGSPLLAALDDDDDAPLDPNQPVFILTPETLDQWIFSNVGNSAQAFSQIDSQVKLRIEAVDRVCSLSPPQKVKLQLAADRDMKKFRDQYDQLKLKYQHTRQNPNNLSKVTSAIAPLKQQWEAGIVGDSSMLAKVIENTLTADQWSAYEKEQSDRKNYRYRAKIKLALATLQSTVPMTVEQGEQLEKLLVAETKPPKKFSQLDPQVVLFQAANLPEAKFKDIFDDGQMKSLQQVFQQFKGFEPMLKQQDVLPD